MRRKTGVIPDHMLRLLMEAGQIIGADHKFVQSASLDLRLSSQFYRVDAMRMPSPGMNMYQLRNLLNAKPCESTNLTPGVEYLAKFQESLKLDEHVYGYANPRSTMGRLDIDVKLIVPGLPRFDTVPERYEGELWAFVNTRSFSAGLHMGDALSQLRLYNGDTRLGEIEMRAEMRQNQLLWNRHEKPYEPYEIKLSDRDGSILLTLDVESRIAGWRSRPHTPLIDLHSTDVDPAEFFEPIEVKDKTVRFEPGRLHILSTNEYLRVPPHLACEMRPMDERSGEFRAHAAGFIAPRWGWGSGGGKGAPLTLEVYPHRPLIVGQGHPVAKIGFERMMDAPDFGSEDASYVMQRGAKLARQFKSA